MKERVAAVMYFSLAAIQTILHYLGWLAIILGAIAFVFGNFERGWQLAASGILFILLKYVLGAIVLPVIALLVKPEKRSNNGEPA